MLEGCSLDTQFMVFRQIHQKCVGEKKVVLYILRSKISLFKILSSCLSSSELASIGKHVVNTSSLPKCHTDYAFTSQLLEAQLGEEYHESTSWFSCCGDWTTAFSTHIVETDILQKDILSDRIS